MSDAVIGRTDRTKVLLIAGYCALVVLSAAYFYFRVTILPVHPAWGVFILLVTATLLAMPWRPIVGLIAFVVLVHGPGRYGEEYRTILTEFDVVSHVTALILAGWLVSLLHLHERPKLSPVLALPLFAFMSWLAITATFAELGLPAWAEVVEHHPVQYAHGLVLFLIGAHTLGTRQTSWLFALALTVVMAIQCVLLGRDLLYLNTDVGAMIPMVLPLTLLGMLIAPNWVMRLLLAGLGLFLMVMFVTTQNRGGAVALIAASLIVLWYFRSWWRWMLAVVPILIVVAAFLTPQAYVDRFSVLWNPQASHATAGLDRSTIESRFRLWDGALALVGTHPWIGVGPGNFPEAIKQVDPADAGYVAHNNFLTVAVETGYAGLVLYVVLFACGLVLCIWIGRVQNAAWISSAGGMLAAALAAYLAAGLFISRQDMALAYLLLGWVSAVYMAARAVPRPAVSVLYSDLTRQRV